jgi:methyl-accepting chemotaxis protein
MFAAGPSGPGNGVKHRRKLSNFLIDKRLQFRYIIAVVLISAVIAAVLGYLIYQQEHLASMELNADLQAMGLDEVAKDLGSKDSALIYKMAAVGIGLAGILSMFLVVMTHKVAGPLFKVSMYFDRMAAGRLSVVTPLRDGDMLRDFFDTFARAHGEMRSRQQSDVKEMESLAKEMMASTDEKVRTAGNALASHAAQRQSQLA